jgi:peptidoglycan/LPS O-acetylase OafA/YrhL
VVGRYGRSADLACLPEGQPGTTSRPLSGRCGVSRIEAPPCKVLAGRGLMRSAKFIPRIESMRGIAALCVAGYHVGGNFPTNTAMKFFMGLSNGIGAVVAFFVMSGFVLARSLDKNPDAIRFVIGRVFRLFPAAIVTIAAFAACYLLFGYNISGSTFDAWNILLNMLMIRTDMNGVMWSMQVELIAAPLILLCVWTFRTRGTGPLWLTIGILFGLSFLGQYAKLLGEGSNLAPLYAFVIGVLVQLRGEKLVASMSRPLASTAALAAVVVFFYCGTLKQTAPVLMIEAISAAVLTAIIAWRTDLTILKPLDWSAIRFYGRISYSFYLLHPLTVFAIGWFVRTADPAIPAVITAIGITAASIVLITGPAYLSWRFVEIPGIALGRLFNGRKATSAIANEVSVRG